MGETTKKNLFLYYYIAKRIFLFMDEWLFYYTVYKLYRMGYRKITFSIIIYGLSCIYTSYTNIEKVEHKLTGITQSIWLMDLSVVGNFIKYQLHKNNFIEYIEDCALIEKCHEKDKDNEELIKEELTKEELVEN